MTSQHYTLKDIAEHLNVPQSNVRYDRSAYREYIPYKTIEGQRHPVYEDEALEVFKLINELKKEGLSRHDIKEKLAEKYQPVYEAETNPEQSESRETDPQQTHNALITASQQQQNLLIKAQQKAIADAAELIESHLQINEHYRVQSEEQRRLITEMQSEIDSLRKRLETGDTNSQNQSKSLIQRLLRR